MDNKKREEIIDAALSNPAEMRKLAESPGLLAEVMRWPSPQGAKTNEDSYTRRVIPRRLQGNRADYRTELEKRRAKQRETKDELRAKKKRERQNKKRGRR